MHEVCAFEKFDVVVIWSGSRRKERKVSQKKKPLTEMGLYERSPCMTKKERDGESPFYFDRFMGL